MARMWLMMGIALLAAGCSNGVAENAETKTGEVGTAATETAAAGDAASPLAEFLGEETFGFGANDDEAEARFAERERASQELIATCMREQGFEYTPVNFDDGSLFGEEDGVEWGTDEWTAIYGYGISTLWFAQDSVGPNLIGHNFDFAFDASNNPNQARLENMSASEQDAYYTALYGDTSFLEQDPTLSDEEAAADDDGGFFEPGGCEGEAYDFGDSMRFFQEFEEDLDDLYRRVESDPRLIDAEREIADCMAGKGLDFTGEQDLFDELGAELTAIEDGLGAPTSELSDEDLTTPSDGQDEPFDVTPELSDDAKTKLAEIQKREVAVAVAAKECGNQSEENEKLFQEVLAEYEQRFLDENQDRLAGYGADS